MSTPVVIIIKGDNQFENVAKQIQDQLGGIETQTGNVGMSWSKLGGMAGSVWGGIKTVIGGVSDAVGSVAKYSGIAFTAIGASGTLALTNIVSTGATFEQKMANVASVTGAVDEEFKQMSQTALDLGSKSRAGAGAAADAMYYLGSAGYDAQQTISALDGVINLATATMSDLAFTSETVVSTITAFGLKAEDATRVSNVFAAAIGKSQLEMNNLAEGMKYIAPVAGVVGWSLEQTTAAMALLSNAGFKGSIAGAALRNILSDLLNPTNQVQEAFARYGLSLDQVNPEMNSLADIMRTISSVGMSTADVMTIFGERGGPQMMALLQQGYGALQTMTNQITGTNAATEMMNRQLDTVKGAWDLLKAALEGVWITLFQFLAPVLQSTLEHITGFVQRIREWLTTNGAVVSWGMVVVTAISAIIGPILILIGMFTGLFAVMVLFAPLALPLIGGAILIALAIWTLIEAVKQADIDWKHTWDHVKEVADYVWEGIKAIFYYVIDKVFPDFKRAGDDLGTWWKRNHDELFRTAMNAWFDIVQWIEHKMDRILEIWKDFIGPALEGDWKKVWGNIKSANATWWKEFVDEDLPKWWKTVADWFKNSAMPVILPIIQDIGTQMGIALVKGMAMIVFSGFKNMWEYAKQWWYSNGEWMSFDKAWGAFESGWSGSQTNLPPGREFGGDHFDQKRGGAAAPRGNTYIMNFHGVTDTHEISRLVIKGIERTAQRGAF